jgi:3'(2'),5'-bisphosphate nucleotidase
VNGLITEQQLRTLCLIAQAAGQEIMDVYAHGGLVVDKEDQSPLTEADLRADRVIAQGLAQHFAPWPVVSEESHEATGNSFLVSKHAGRADHESPTFFLVDPLDGTKEFIKRSGEFTVNIALIHAGQAVAGVVLAPALGELFCGASGVGVFKRDEQGVRPIKTTRPHATNPLRVIGSRSHGADKVDQWLQTLDRPYTFVAAGSSLKFCRIAEGLADVYPRLGPTCQWDTAAAQAVLALAGGAVTDLDGQPLAYGPDRPLLNPEFVASGVGGAIHLHAKFS